MARKKRTKNIVIKLEHSERAFRAFLRRVGGKRLRELRELRDKGFSALGLRREQKYLKISVELVKRLLSTEKARILVFLRERQASSIYELAKLLGRDFKSVREDVLILERFGLLSLKKERKGNRQRLRPVLAADTLNITVEI